MKIKSIKKVEPRTVYAVQTSSHTFIADGLAHHNCPGCNTYRSGEQAEYLLFIEEKYGREAVDYLMKKKREWNGTGGPTTPELREMVEKYKLLVDNLS